MTRCRTPPSKELLVASHLVLCHLKDHNHLIFLMSKLVGCLVPGVWSVAVYDIQRKSIHVKR